MQGPHGTESRKLIREYADAVINDEWQTMGESNAGSRRGRRDIGNLDRQFSHLTPAQKLLNAQVHTAFLRTKSLIVAARNRRLLEASDTIPCVMWLGPIGGGIIMMLMSLFIYMAQAWPHMLMASL